MAPPPFLPSSRGLRYKFIFEPRPLVSIHSQPAPSGKSPTILTPRNPHYLLSTVPPLFLELLLVEFLDLWPFQGLFFHSVMSLLSFPPLLFPLYYREFIPLGIFFLYSSQDHLGCHPKVCRFLMGPLKLGTLILLISSLSPQTNSP